MEDWGDSSGNGSIGSGSSGGGIGSSDGRSDKESVGLIVGTCERQQQQAGSSDSRYTLLNAEMLSVLAAVTNA
jgi:hypothetical protein